MEVKDGGPAFPRAYSQYTDEEFQALKGDKYFKPQSGMTLRDYFAGQALIGMSRHQIIEYPNLCAKECYEIADALLKARENKS